jgi:hypothetical protein
MMAVVIIVGRVEVMVLEVESAILVTWVMVVTSRMLVVTCKLQRLVKFDWKEKKKKEKYKLINYHGPRSR